MLEQIGKSLASLGFGRAALIIFFISLFIDISPIKFSPIKAIFKFMGRWFNSSVEKEIAGFKVEMNQKFDELKTEQKAQRETLDQLAKDQESEEASSLCWSIIDFRNSIENGEKHTRDQYRHMIDCARKYERIATTSPNIKVEAETLQQIRECAEEIKKHYESGRGDQTVLYF